MDRGATSFFIAGERELNRHIARPSLIRCWWPRRPWWLQRVRAVRWGAGRSNLNHSSSSSQQPTAREICRVEKLGPKQKETKLRRRWANG